MSDTKSTAPITDTARERYLHVTTLPGSFVMMRRPISPTLPESKIFAARHWVEDLTGGKNSLLVITGGSLYDRTTVGAQSALAATQDLGLCAEAETKYWTEFEYTANRKMLKSKEDFAKAFRDDSMLAEFRDYERKFTELEGCRFLFLDCIGVSGLWPSDTAPLVELIRARMEQGMLTSQPYNLFTLVSVPALDDAFLSRYPFFAELDSMEDKVKVIDLGTR